MSFKHWYQALEMIIMFAVVIIPPCFFAALWGSKMINDIGNHPSKSDKIQATATGKFFIVEVVSSLLLIALFAILF